MDRSPSIGFVPVFVALSMWATAALGEDVPSPPERPVTPAIVFFPGSAAGPSEGADDGTGPVLTVYDAQSCDARIAGECALVTFTCDDREKRGLGITIDAVETAQVVKWLEAEGDESKGLQLALEGLVPEGPPVLGAIRRSEFGGGWAVTFFAPFTADPGLTIAGDALVVTAMPRATTLELTDANRSALKQFTDLCAIE